METVPQSTLVYHTGAIGDFITALPALVLWKERHPGCRLTLICRRSIGELAMDIGIADEWHDSDSAALVPLFRNEFTPEAAVFLSRFGAAVVFVDDHSPVLANLHAALIKPIHSQPPFPAGRIHVIDYHLSLLTNPADLPQSQKLPRIVPSSRAIERSLALVPYGGPSPVVLHHGSGSARKNWPLERFRELAEALRDRGFTVVWLAGPAEAGLGAAEAPESLLTSPPLPVLAAVLARCRLFIGNDSGIAHLAAAVGSPAIAIFGPSDPAVWAPRGERVTIIHKNDFCPPCHRSARQPCERRCLAAIGVADVLAAVDGAISSPRPPQT